MKLDALKLCAKYNFENCKKLLYITCFVSRTTFKFWELETRSNFVVAQKSTEINKAMDFCAETN